MKILTPILCAASLLLISTGVNYAQETAATLKAPTTAVTIDGNNKEWGNDLAYYNADKKIHYTISNDKNNLYLVIKTNDEKQFNNILFGGVTFSIDTKGRKKKTQSITFPLQEMVITESITFNTLDQKRNEARSTQLKKIEVKGFSDISEDRMYNGNPYKIQTALNFDDNGYLVYEEAIPLALFKAEGLATSEWAYNIKLNAVTARLQPNSQTTVGTATVSSVIVAVPAGSGPPSNAAVQAAVRNNSYTQNSMASSAAINIPARDVEIVRASDFWGKFSLAK
ncbi:hypothetical protein GCM10027049_24910 [Mucilaginibacter puniceus]